MVLIKVEHLGDQQKEQSAQHLYASQQKEVVVQVTTLIDVVLLFGAWQATVDVAGVMSVEPDVGGTQAGNYGSAHEAANSGEEVEQAHDDSIHGAWSYRHSKLQTCVEIGQESQWGEGANTKRKEGEKGGKEQQRRKKKAVGENRSS